MQKVLNKAEEYRMNAGRTGLAHYKAAEIAAKRSKQIGMPTVALSAVVATSIFATLSESVDIKIKIVTGVFALATAILAALQAFLSYGDRAEKHKAAGAKYGSLRRKIDLFLLEFSEKKEKKDRNSAITEIKNITEELSSLAIESPTLTEKVYKSAQLDFNKRHKK